MQDSAKQIGWSWKLEGTNGVGQPSVDQELDSKKGCCQCNKVLSDVSIKKVNCMVFNIDDKPSDIKRVCYSCNKNSSDVNTEYITCKA